MDPFMTFSTQRPKLSIQIDGTTYPVLLPVIFRFSDTMRFEKARQRAVTLQEHIQKGDLPQDQIEAAEIELETLIDALFDLILREVPLEVRKKLTDLDRLALLRSYNAALERLTMGGNEWRS